MSSICNKVEILIGELMQKNQQKNNRIINMP